MSFSGATIDSREVKKNNIFFALKGKNTDGHKFLDVAFKNGARLAVVSKIQKNIKIPQIKVFNVHKAMIKLARKYREDLEGKIIAITGSIENRNKGCFKKNYSKRIQSFLL